MPKRKANWWPPSILSDPDVLSVDDEGRFVLCKICHVHYAVHGGKKPKPVIMNSNFRTRAWDVHKGRTNSHRLQKQRESLEQGKPQVHQHAIDPSGRKHQQKQHTQSEQGQQTQVVLPSQTQSNSEHQSQSVPPLSTSKSTHMPVSHRQLQGQIKRARAQESSSRAPQQPHNATQDSQQRRQPQDQERYPQQLQDQEHNQSQQLDVKEITDTEQGRLRVTAPNIAIKRSASVSSDLITAKDLSDASKINHDGKIHCGKQPMTKMPMSGPLIPRRRTLRAGSLKPHTAESEPARGGAGLSFKENYLFMAQDMTGITLPTEHAMAIEQQADSSARWRHMHDDVSRALNAAPRERHSGSISHTNGELRAAKTLVQTETGDLGGNNSERVAKKLRSLNAEYHASNMRHADAYNMRHSEVFDRGSAGYKEYWGTLRDVYTSSGTTSGEGSGLHVARPFRKAHHLRKSIQVESKETEADSTTPDDSGSSEDAFKPTVVIHDASLTGAMERLTKVTLSHIANLYKKETVDTKKTLAGLTSVMTDLRVQHGSSFERMIELQEKQLKVMENILEMKLRKEAVRNGSVISSGSSSRGRASNQGPTIAFSAQPA